MTALLPFFASCSLSSEDNPVPEKPLVEVSVLSDLATKTCIEGTVTATFKPSGKTEVIKISSISTKADRNNFKELDMSLCSTYTPESVDSFWNRMIVSTKIIEGEKTDTECIITTQLKPVAGLESSEDKFDLCVIIDYTTYHDRDSDVQISRGIAGKDLQRWCDLANSTSTTVRL